MTELLRGWVLGITGAAMVTAVTLTITPEGRAKRVVSVVCGFMMLVALIAPIHGFDYGEFSRGISRLRVDAEEISAMLDETNENISRRIIEDGYAAYISDKGTVLGIENLYASVEAAPHGDGLWYPAAAYVTTDADAHSRERLAYAIEADLGIAPENIHWHAWGA